MFANRIIVAVLTLYLFSCALASTVSLQNTNGVLTFSTSNRGSVTIDLATDTPITTTHYVDSAWIVNRNGVDGIPSVAYLTVRKGPEYFVVFDDNDNVIYITGDMLRLSSTASQGILLDEWYLYFNPSAVAVEDDDGLNGLQMPALSSLSMPSCTPQDAQREVELAIATDFTFCERFAGLNFNVAEARIRSLIVETESKYAEASCLMLSPKYIELHCSSLAEDPYISFMEPFKGEAQWSSTNFLNALRDLWQLEPRASIHRDDVLLITGWDNEYGVAGTARVSGVCDNYRGFGWAEMRWVPTLVVAHELGHNLALLHDDSSGSGKNIMNAGISRDSNQFSSVSATALQNFLLTTSTSCITAPSPTVTPSPSQTSSPTVSVSPTTSASASVTPSSSVSVSATPSVSISPSQTSVPSNSASPSTTISASASPSFSASISATPSVSSSPSQTSEPTVSVSPSNSISSSASPTSSSSISSTPSASNTVSSSPSASASSSISPGASISASPSSSPSSILSVSPSVSSSPEVSVSVTAASSASVSPSKQAVSTSAPPTKSAEPSTSTSSTPTVSPTASTSVSLSVSPTASTSVSPTPSSSASPSQTPSPSVSPSTTPFTISGCVQELLARRTIMSKKEIMRTCANPWRIIKSQQKERFGFGNLRQWLQ